MRDGCASRMILASLDEHGLFRSDKTEEALMKNQRNRARLRVALILALVGLLGIVVLVLAPSRRASAQAGASWRYTGNLNFARAVHTATLLPNGKVLVAGGSDLESAELYNPTTGVWINTGNLNAARSEHTATLLPNGKVLIVGGTVGGPEDVVSVNSAELYDPATGTWSSTGNLNTARSQHTATLLPNGKVLIAGGGDYVGGFFHKFNSAEVY